MKIPKPYIPLRAESYELNHTVHIAGRDYTFGTDGMLVSIKSQGHELLAAPVRIVSMENGEPSVWDNNYAENESESFIQSRADDKIVICGAKQSERFIINTCSTVDYDGNIDIDFKLMTRSLTVAQRYGVSDIKAIQYILDKLWIEIPLKASECTLFHMFENSELKYEDGTIRPKTSMSSSGKIPERSVSMPFKPLLWIGNEERGFGWFAENNHYWQPDDENAAMELIHDDDTVFLRIRLLDSHPRAWDAIAEKGYEFYHPIDFHFGFHITPVKEFPKQPYIHNAFHIDCGFKIKGNYIDYLSENNRFDLLAEKGVTTLILHEKWNKCQNWFELSEFTSNQLKYICDECHKRGIKVLPYFGYELSTMAPVWSEAKDKMAVTRQNKLYGGWWRVPFQRDYVVCYNTEYADLFIDGITKLMDTYHIDGVYLDGTAFPRYCEDIEHGCGWYDYDGNLRGSYPFKAIRRMFKRLYDVVTSRGGEINAHVPGMFNFTAAPYIHQFWLGEYLQRELMQGSTEDINLDYFRAEFIGRNMGVPVEFIAYENRPFWTFENAVSMSILHGILPRPNNIDYPLELMSGIWKIFDAFPIDKSEWKPYWNNDVQTSHEKVKVSYYKYTSLTGEDLLLAFAVNISSSDISSVTINFEESVTSVTDMTNKTEIGFTFDLQPYGYKILYLK